MTINASGKKLISVSPTSASTDEYGQADFTITVKRKTGNATVAFKDGSLSIQIGVALTK